MTQKERQERSKEEIYLAALDEFGTHGYDSVNMERICSNHGISKGMMYHYYSGKDELFLLCVDRTFRDLKAYVEREMDMLEDRDVPDAIKDFFMIREYFFQLNPKQKSIFESALLRPPKHLADKIQLLRVPIRQVNQKFFHKLIIKIPLRQDLDPEMAIRYLESVESLFQSLMTCYQSGRPPQDFHTMLKTAGEILNMILFGVLRQTDRLEADKSSKA